MAGHEFKVGDQVAHEEFGNGKIIYSGSFSAKVKFAGRCHRFVFLNELRPRNFLAKIAEEQEGKDPVEDNCPRYDISPDTERFLCDNTKTVGQQFNEVFKEPSAADIDPALGGGIAGQMVMTKNGFREFITDKYGIKRDPVTLLEIESDGLVQISSIKSTVR